MRYKSIVAAVLAAVCLPAMAGCSEVTGVGAQNDDKTIRFVSTNIALYEDTTKVLAEEVKKRGYTLDYKFITDGPALNSAVENGEADATYHQHAAYLQYYDRQFKGNLVAAFDAFTDPSGLFSKKWKSIQDLPDGAVVTAHIEPANFYRPFLMLQDAGLIKLRPGVDPLSITESDIIDNPRHIKIQGLDYALLPKALDDADAGFLYASQAADIGIDFHTALVTESKQNQSPDVIAVKNGQQDTEKIKVLKESYQTDEVKKQLVESFGGKEVVIPAW
ncbi:MetQ/NlpA family ABC transporter substrate-binding protein [Mycolicibacterium komossense]|uniref:MetQ/NlpA family ABC transporter substrate-binding protein n=1 Tax=Mycolicibacterium komossense TaxID=1779 RepID=A0ABT3CEZ7_9MYCO|nr:MetQ/NlpA family ABC transporter substrate-binding protein [Mycolicibacterium komossense]MCV7228066.1 MetQ/NlpA family ABC transporter substrate-binding protein [Mycolicibacterium komossense]